MNQQEIMTTVDEYVLHTYNRFPISIDRGMGTHVWDSEGKEYLDFMAGIAVYALGYHSEGKEYLDFMAGIAVYALGYHYPEYDEALKAQIDKVLHTSNLYYHEPLALAARAVVESTGLSKVFFTNSGAEAIEGAIKSARKYAWMKDGKNNHEIIAMKSSFHGRSVGALSVTGNAHYQDPFKPLMGGVVFAEFNNLQSVLDLVNDTTCAILLETVQGEGGIYPATPEFLQGIRKLCDEKDILLILDEIQCGMGRTGTMWAYEQYGIKPDIVTCAKALGCGVPVGAFVLNEKAAAKGLMPGDHGTTYGGNPFVCAAVAEVFSLYEKIDLISHVKEISEYLAASLDAFAEKHECVAAHRGLGLIRGLEFTKEVPVGEVTKKALEKGLLIISAGSNVLRFVPPLIITKEDVDEAMAILEECI